jgi:hypothetical protein
VEKRWLLVDLHEGMFPTERVVQIKTFDGNSLSIFVPAESVREESGRGRIQVDLLQSRPEVSLIGLPSEAIEGQRVAKVAASELSK